MSYKTTKTAELRKNFNQKKYGAENNPPGSFVNKKTAFVKKTAAVSTPQSSQPNNIVTTKVPETAKFVKIKSKPSTTIHPNGLGHSYTKNRNFIRRCSTTTTQTDASTNTTTEPCETPHFSPKSWSTEMPKDCLVEFTAQRKCYEAASRSGQLRNTCMPNCKCKQPASSTYFSPVTKEDDVDFDKTTNYLEDLQAFRLNNPDDCFGEYSRCNQPLPRLKDLLSDWYKNESPTCMHLNDFGRARYFAKSYVNEEPKKEYSMRVDKNNNLINTDYKEIAEKKCSNKYSYEEPKPEYSLSTRNNYGLAKISSNKDPKRTLDIANSCSTKNIHFNERPDAEYLEQSKYRSSLGKMHYINKLKKSEHENSYSTNEEREQAYPNRTGGSFNVRDPCYIQEPIPEFANGIKNTKNLTILPPYAARQKLQQIQNNSQERENSKSRKKSQNFLQNSIALRYQEML